jgi:hypothetical protein
MTRAPERHSSLERDARTRMGAGSGAISADPGAPRHVRNRWCSQNISGECARQRLREGAVAEGCDGSQVLS